MTLTDAIQAVENAQLSLTNADTAQAAANEKFNSAKLAKESADSIDADAVKSFNGALDNLVAIATASKIIR